MRVKPCSHCGKKHDSSKCHKKFGACFKCGEVGHKVNACPQKRGSQESEAKGNAQKPQAQGIVDAITQQDAEASKVVVEGTLVICQRLAKILIDIGFTHSYVSPAFAPKLNVPLALLDFTLTVIIPIGDTLDIDNVCKSCVVKFK